MSAKGEMIEPIPSNAYTRKYPLARSLFIYVNYKPRSELDPLRREFIKYVFSKEGQGDVIKDGYLPVKPLVAANTLKSVGIKP
jgi:phosphate transport system substrate-binding protein